MIIVFVYYWFAFCCVRLHFVRRFFLTGVVIAWCALPLRIIITDYWLRLLLLWFLLLLHYRFALYQCDCIGVRTDTCVVLVTLLRYCTLCCTCYTIYSDSFCIFYYSYPFLLRLRFVCVLQYRVAAFPVLWPTFRRVSCCRVRFCILIVTVQYRWTHFLCVAFVVYSLRTMVVAPLLPDRVVLLCGTLFPDWFCWCACYSVARHARLLLRAILLILVFCYWRFWLLLFCQIRSPVTLLFDTVCVLDMGGERFAAPDTNYSSAAILFWTPSWLPVHVSLWILCSFLCVRTFHSRFVAVAGWSGLKHALRLPGAGTRHVCVLHFFCLLLDIPSCILSPDLDGAFAFVLVWHITNWPHLVQLFPVPYAFYFWYWTIH